MWDSVGWDVRWAEEGRNERPGLCQCPIWHRLTRWLLLLLASSSSGRWVLNTCCCFVAPCKIIEMHQLVSSHCPIYHHPGWSNATKLLVRLTNDESPSHCWSQLSTKRLGSRQPGGNSYLQSWEPRPTQSQPGQSKPWSSSSFVLTRVPIGDLASASGPFPIFPMGLLLLPVTLTFFTRYLLSVICRHYICCSNEAGKAAC